MARFLQYLAAVVAACAVAVGALPLEGRAADDILVGIGKADITPPIGEITMLGYADLGQKASGIHLRLNARAFIFASAGTPANRAVFVSAELGFMSQRARLRVVDLVKAALPAAEAAYYSVDNLMVSATHTHSGPGGFQDYFMYQVTNFGVTPGSREAVSQGIANAILAAHRNLALSKVVVGVQTLTDANINRSPMAYLNNPASERAKYSANTDQELIQLTIADTTGKLRGAVNWFPVHPVSMNVSNQLVDSDNKGYAAYKWEIEQLVAGNSGFISAFSQANAGDVSPNLQGPRCLDTGVPCDGGPTSCGGDFSKCVARGPGYEIGGDVLSNKIIGQRQLSAAQAAASRVSSDPATTGPVLFRHAFVRMPDVRIPLSNGTTLSACLPAMGYSFSAGTTDNPATGISYQGDNSTNNDQHIFWNLIRNVISTPTRAQEACHAPKPILLNTGEATVPYTWQPLRIPIQLFVIGKKFAIIGFPSEITTMAGRRMKDTVKSELVKAGVLDADARVAISGLTNIYNSYVTTWEEYQFQRYEGACTVFGPHTLAAYQQVYTVLAQSFKNTSLITGPATPTFPVTTVPPDDVPTNELNLLTGVVLDTAPLGKEIGNTLIQPPATARFNQTVSATFQCAHPRNGGRKITDSPLKETLLNGRLPSGAQETFMTVDKKNANGSWTVVLDDAWYDTKYAWTRVGSSESTCKVSWTIGDTFPVTSGTYRFRVFGTHSIFGILTKFVGTSNEFVVTI